MISTQLIGEVLGEAVGGPAGAVVGGTSAGFVTRIFGGAGVDRQRQDRVNWTLQQAINGSITAGEIIIAAPQNVSGNEADMWTRALSQVPSNVLATANNLTQGQGWWPAGQPDFYTDVNGSTHQQIVAEVRASGNPTTQIAPQTTPTSVTQQGQQAQPLPAVRTIAAAPASSSSLWYIVGGVVLLVVVAFVVLRHRR